MEEHCRSSTSVLLLDSASWKGLISRVGRVGASRSDRPRVTLVGCHDMEIISNHEVLTPPRNEQVLGVEDYASGSKATHSEAGYFGGDG